MESETNEKEITKEDAIVILQILIENSFTQDFEVNLSRKLNCGRAEIWTKVKRLRDKCMTIRDEANKVIPF